MTSVFREQTTEEGEMIWGKGIGSAYMVFLHPQYLRVRSHQRSPRMSGRRSLGFPSMGVERLRRLRGASQ